MATFHDGAFKHCENEGQAPASRGASPRGAVLSTSGWAAGIAAPAESRKHKAVKVFRQISCIGPIRAALLLALTQTLHRFRSKRQLSTYSGLGVELRDSAQHRNLNGRLQRSNRLKALYRGWAFPVRVTGLCSALSGAVVKETGVSADGGAVFGAEFIAC